MPFDPEKDKVLKTWRCEETGLIISINQYNEGQPKVQIGPRILMKKDGGGERAPMKAGRLTVEAGRSNFSLATLPREDFPVMASSELAGSIW